MARLTEYAVHFWGAGAAAKAKETGATPDDGGWTLWFDDLDAALAKQRAFQCSIQTICTSVYQGKDVRVQTVASMTFEYQGKRYEAQENYGYGYPGHTAEFDIEENNNSCDCNRSALIRETDESFPELPCGEEIELIELTLQGGDTEWVS
jgi:hypothetical protein